MTFSRLFNRIYDAFDFCINGNAECFKVHIFEHCNEIPGKFKEILQKQENLFLKSPYLLSLEESKPDGMHFAYACIEKGDNAIAFMYFQLLKINLEKAEDFLNPRYFENAMEGIKKGKDNFFLKKILGSNMYIMFCGNVFLSGENGIYIKPDFKNDELLTSLPALLQEVIERAGETGKIAGVVIKDFYDNKHKSIALLEKEGYKKFYFEPNLVMQINIGWTTFDDYLIALSSKYRVRAKNVFKKSEQISVKDFNEKEIRAFKHEIKKLYDQVHQKAAVHFSSLNESYFSNLKNRLKDDFLFKAFFLEDKMVGFSTFIFGDGTAEAHLVGLDYEYNKPYALYPLILYTYIEDAISRGSTEISFGRTALEIKSTVGAKPKPMYCYVGLQKPLSMKMISPFISLSVEAETTVRDPFKENLEDEMNQTIKKVV